MSPQSETCSWWTAESGEAHPKGSPPSSPPPPEQKIPKTQTKTIMIKYINRKKIYFEFKLFCSLLCSVPYHRASLNYGKDAAKDPRTDEQLPLLAQVQVDVVQNHWQQNTSRLWGKRERKQTEQTEWRWHWKELHAYIYRNKSVKDSHLTYQGRRRVDSRLYELWTAVWLHPLIGQCLLCSACSPGCLEHIRPPPEQWTSAAAHQRYLGNCSTVLPEEGEKNKNKKILYTWKR